MKIESMTIDWHLHPFFIEGQFLNWPETHVDFYHCSYIESNYSDALFEKYGIAYPNSLNTAVHKRRAEYFAGRYCSMRLLNSYGFSDTDVGVGKNRYPVWPSGVAGSISHSKYNAIAVSSTGSPCYNLGVDIESVVTEKTLNTIGNRIMFGKESILVHCSNKPRVLFTIIFSVKESFFKAVYPLVKRYFDFDAIEVMLIDFESEIIEFRVVKPPSNEFKVNSTFKGYFRSLNDEMIATYVQI